MPEKQLFHELIQCCHDLAMQGHAPASSGNASFHTVKGVWITQGGAILSQLNLEDFVLVDANGNQLLGGGKPSKEVLLHLAIYHNRPQTKVVLHLHPPHSIAMASLIAGDDPEIPVMVPTFIMRVNGVSAIPYFPPGDPGLAKAVGVAMTGHQVVFLRNHGIVSAGESVAEAKHAIEESELNARIFLLSGGKGKAIPEVECETLTPTVLG